MLSLNKVFLIGTVIKDLDRRATNSGAAVVNAKVEIRSQYKDTASGEMKDKTTWIAVSAFGKIAENIDSRIEKGTPVFVEGSLNTRTWEKQDGTKQTSMEVTASKIQVVDMSAPATAPAPAATQEGEEVPF
jgi:single-strand DNA-binding protein